MPRASKRILSADEIKAGWDAEKVGAPPPAAAALVEERKKNEALEKENAQLEGKAKKYDKTRNHTGEVRDALEALLRQHGISPATELVELALERYPEDFVDKTLAGRLLCTVDQRIKIWQDLLGYQLPKLRSVEMAGQIDAGLTVIIKKFGEETTLIERKLNGPIDVPAIVNTPPGQPLVDVPSEEVKRTTF